MGFRVLGFRVLGFRVQGLGFRVLEFRLQSLGFRVLGLRVQGLGFRCSASSEHFVNSASYAESSLSKRVPGSKVPSNRALRVVNSGYLRDVRG